MLTARIFVLLGALCLTISCVQQNSITQASTEKKAIVPAGLEWAVDSMHFSPAVVDGDRIWLSGVLAVQKEPGEAGMEAAITAAFEEIQLVLLAAGSDWDQVLDITTFHVDLPSQRDLIHRVKDRYIKAPYPTWTAIGVEALWLENAITEIRVVARKKP